LPLSWLDAWQLRNARRRLIRVWLLASNMYLCSEYFIT
jgi:hypothetical protein